MSEATLQVNSVGEREIELRRVFSASPEAVFEALTEPELIRRWLLGPPGWAMVECEVDLRVGGRYRFAWENEADGSRMGMGGAFREIVPNRRVVQTERFDEPWYEGEALLSADLAGHNGRTTLTATLRYGTQATRDMVLDSGMTEGIAASYERLEQLLVEDD